MPDRSLVKPIILSGMVGHAAQPRNIAAKKLKQQVDARFNVGYLGNPIQSNPSLPNPTQPNPTQPACAWAQAGMRGEIGSQASY